MSTAAVFGEVQSLSPAFKRSAEVLIPGIDQMKVRLRQQMAITMDVHRDLVTDFMCGGMGPRFRLFRNWVMTRFRRSGPIFSLSKF